MQDRVFKDPKIEVIWNTEAIEAVGQDKLTGVRTKNAKTGEEKVLDVNGLFYAIGTQFEIRVIRFSYVLHRTRSKYRIFGRTIDS